MDYLTGFVGVLNTKYDIEYEKRYVEVERISINIMETYTDKNNQVSGYNCNSHSNVEFSEGLCEVLNNSTLDLDSDYEIEIILQRDSFEGEISELNHWSVYFSDPDFGRDSIVFSLYFIYDSGILYVDYVIVN